MSAVVVRYYAAVKDGIVVGSRSSVRCYRWAVLMRHPAFRDRPLQWFATFHRDMASVEQVMGYESYQTFDKELVEVVETTERLAVGAPFVVAPEDQEFDQVDEHAQRQAEILEGIWRNS